MVLDDKRLLIVEDDIGLQNQMRWCFDEDISTCVAHDKDSALSQLRRNEPQVVTLDLGLPPDPGGASQGFIVLEEILRLAPHTKVIVITGREEKDHALQAIDKGACDFYQKPVDAEVLSFVVNRAFRLSALEEENNRLRSLPSSSKLEGMITSSHKMLNICRTIEKVAPTNATTLVLGETGTGKELIARALHTMSTRTEKPFATINCAAIPDSLLESELFGYEKGAFTGASNQKAGKIEHADGGTLFLDEIGDMPLSLQAKLLRFLQERVIERVGGHKEIPVDVRVVCATHRNLESMIKENLFREDLYYRISEITINVPPLRERDGDAVVLANALLKQFSTQLSRNITGFTPDAIKSIEAYDWPGNVREMVNKIKRAVIMAEGKRVSAEDIELSKPGDEEKMPLNLREVREYAEKNAVIRALHNSENMAQAARLLGITRPTLYNLVDKYRLQTYTRGQ